MDKNAAVERCAPASYAKKTFPSAAVERSNGAPARSSSPSTTNAICQSERGVMIAVR